jgi:hypothetical protein
LVVFIFEKREHINIILLANLLNQRYNNPTCQTEDSVDR